MALRSNPRLILASICFGTRSNRVVFLCRSLFSPRTVSASWLSGCLHLGCTWHTRSCISACYFVSRRHGRQTVALLCSVRKTCSSGVPFQSRRKLCGRQWWQNWFDGDGPSTPRRKTTAVVILNAGACFLCSVKGSRQYFACTAVVDRQHTSTLLTTERLVAPPAEKARNTPKKLLFFLYNNNCNDPNAPKTQF